MNRTEYMNEWRRNNRDKTRAQFKRWYEKKGKEHRRAYYLANKISALAYQATYRKTHSSKKYNPKIKSDGIKKQHTQIAWANLTEQGKQKHRTRRNLYHAVKTGKIKRLPCEICAEQKSEAHHPDYAKPLEVKWLCRKHHALIHRKYK